MNVVEFLCSEIAFDHTTKLCHQLMYDGTWNHSFELNWIKNISVERIITVINKIMDIFPCYSVKYKRWTFTDTEMKRQSRSWFSITGLIGRYSDSDFQLCDRLVALENSQSVLWMRRQIQLFGIDFSFLICRLSLSKFFFAEAHHLEFPVFHVLLFSWHLNQFQMSYTDLWGSDQTNILI